MKKYRIVLGFLVLFLISQNINSQSNYKALGIWDYPNPVPGKLSSNFENDANDLKQYLIDYQNWNANNIEIKVNSVATAANITSYISNMPNTRGITELFTYGGHGLNEETNVGLQTYSGMISPQLRDD